VPVDGAVIRQRPGLPPSRRFLLSKILVMLGTPEALDASLNIIEDAIEPAVPYEVWQGLESLFVERRPYGTGGASTLLPTAANIVRARLATMAMNDPRRRKAAADLLAQIELWRLQYGRPAGEPRNPLFQSGTAWLDFAAPQ
jgi:NACHT C-terminal Alpha/Beta 2